METNHYYPFGGVFSTSSNVQPYKYNGKELDTKNGLNWYDYGARHYDAALGRFLTIDPLSEKHYSNSSYTYCLNNPVCNIDGSGYGIATIIAGAAIGGLLSAGLEMLLQLIDGRTFKTFDWKSISIEFFNGALTGGLIGAGLPACWTTQGRAIVNAISSLFHSINKRDNFWVAVLKILGSYLATMITGIYAMGKGKYKIADNIVETIVQTVKSRFSRFTIRVGFIIVKVVLDKIRKKG
jgi:RHS repeat-associated protein